MRREVVIMCEVYDNWGQWILISVWFLFLSILNTIVTGGPSDHKEVYQINDQIFTVIWGFSLVCKCSLNFYFQWLTNCLSSSYPSVLSKCLHDKLHFLILEKRHKKNKLNSGQTEGESNQVRRSCWALRCRLTGLLTMKT